MSPMLIITLLLYLLQYSESKVVTRTLGSTKGWTFLTRFCFISDNDVSGRYDDREFKYSVTLPSKSHLTPPKLHLYYDSPEQWATVYNSDLTCGQKQNLAVDTIDSFYTSSPSCSQSADETFLTCTGSRRFTQSRARWWYIAVSNCEGSSWTINYTLTMTNGNTFHDKHFSADEIGILEGHIVTTIITLFVLVVTLIYSYYLEKRRLNHCTFKTYQCSVFFYLMKCVLCSVYYIQYGIEGHSSHSLLVIAKFADVVATNCFLGLLLSLSSGYTIVTGMISLCSFSCIVSVIGMFALLMLSSIIWEENVFDPGKVLYTYMSPPGYLLASLYVPSWLYFLIFSVKTFLAFPKKRGFYLIYSIMSTFWFMSLPSLIIIANEYLEDWIRMKVVVLVQHFIWVFCYCYFIVIFQPTQGNLYFPFHLRVTQVDTGTSEAGDGNYNCTAARVEECETSTDNKPFNGPKVGTDVQIDIFAVK